MHVATYLSDLPLHGGDLRRERRDLIGQVRGLRGGYCLHLLLRRAMEGLHILLRLPRPLHQSG